MIARCLAAALLAVGYTMTLTAHLASAQVSDVLPPKAPSSLNATAAGVQITLKWTAARDNVAVTSYVVQRCQGAGCANFARIATTGGRVTTYVDGGVAAKTTYSYRVRGIDAAGNLGRLSNVASATTKSAGTPPPPPPSSGQSLSPRVATLTFTLNQQFTSDVSPAVWSVDGIVGGSESTGTITSNGLYSPPSQVGAHTVRAKAGGQSATATVHVTNYPGTFTQHNDNARTGQNLNETVLTRTNVASATFGKLFSYPLDGIAYASPLYVANVNMGHQGFHNVVYVATEHDSVYAFDADGRRSRPLWHVSFINAAAGITTVPADDTSECCDIAPEIGITGTPVIDETSHTLYVVAKTKEVSGNTTQYVQRLHALDIATGAEKFGGPVEIEASVPGLGDGSQGGQVPFDVLYQNQRAALLLNNGVVYIAFGSHGDNPPYHGWILGYDARTLQQVMALNVTPNGWGGGVWQGGGGLAADSTGNIYFATGNGSFDVNTGGFDYGDSIIKMSPGGVFLDFFTPHDQATLAAGDIDLGSGGVMLLPNQGGAPPLLVQAGKDGTMYLVNRNKMGHYNPNNDNQVVQSLSSIFSASFGAPVYFDGSVYFSGVVATIKAFSLQGGMLSVGPTSGSAESYNFPGAALAISADGDSNGILWAIQQNGSSAAGVLRAYDAGNLNNTLYSSDAMGSRDALDVAAKFSIPLVANGKVFVGSMSRLTVYGLLP